MTSIAKVTVLGTGVLGSQMRKRGSQPIAYTGKGYAIGTLREVCVWGPVMRKRGEGR